MDNGDNRVIYASVMLPEEVAYLQAMRAMHHAHQRARATSDFFPNTLVVRASALLPEEAAYLEAQMAMH
ncbi:hypothetical protein D1007_04163 [Hordeum vulgare]|nr:hypothetical protein D1007_04163 [Hordeum vulgare]